MLQLALLMMGQSRLIASLQAPHQFYLGENRPDTRIGYNWGTRSHGDSAIAFHHRMVRQLRHDLEARFQIPAQRTILMGFSQPVGYNYRLAATHPDEIGGVIGICGGVPKDWETGNYGQVRAPLLHIARSEDEFFPEEITADYARKLRTRASDVEFHLLPGGHRFPSKGFSIIEPWLNRIFGVSR
jgi:predicted esterase